MLHGYNPNPRSLKTRVGGLCVEAILGYIMKPCLGRKKNTQHMHDFLVVFLFCISRTPIEKMLLYDLHYASKCHSTASQIFTPFPSVSNGTLCKFLHLLRQVTLFSLCADGYTTLGFCLVCKHFTTHLPLASVILGFAV